MQAVKEKQFTDDYQVKNLLLTQPADWYIDKETFKKVGNSQEKLKDFFKNNGQNNIPDLPIDSDLTEHLKNVYSIPLFSEIFCDIFKDELTNMEKHFNFNPNPEEDKLRQIPEIVLQECAPEIYGSLMQVVFAILNPIFMSLWGRVVSGGGIQVANYNLKEKKQGAWHHDSSADISVVVPLNTGDYKGGGTEFSKLGTVEPIPNGNALMFPSFTHMHRGLPIEAGDRYLLVFWLVCKNSFEDKKNFIDLDYN